MALGKKGTSFHRRRDQTVENFIEIIDNECSMNERSLEEEIEKAEIQDRYE